jgi:hypothetical protein
MQPGIGLGDPLQPSCLVLGEVGRVLPEGVTRAPQCPGCASGELTGLAPGLGAGLADAVSAHVVEGVLGPAHNVERIGAVYGLGAAPAHHPIDPVGGIA